MSAVRNFLRVLFQFMLLAAFAIWFGGFFFYVSLVVPIGTEVLGSAFDQGMITRRVTIALNYLCGAAVILMLFQCATTWSRTPSPQKQIQLGATLLILGLLVCLFVLHPRIDAYVDLDARDIVGDYDQFYFLHRLYLWTSTFQWIAAVAWLACYASISRRSQDPRSNEPILSEVRHCIDSAS